ncbi:P-loop containing nucleoside triphosphate hydrolase protein [Mycena latifolia]|nr:P-loop containing nucleoside triphosphate hydrolase protein [Mycena latifolia]
MALNTDRRSGKRVVPMQVLALGFSRTGTTSLRIALETLGYKETNHGPYQWTEAINAKYHGKGKPYGRAEWDRLLGHCMAVTDVPHILFAEELIDAYPEAKVILTTRDPDSWWKSYSATIESGLRNPLFAWTAWLEPQRAGKVHAFWHLVFHAMFKTRSITPEIAKARFTAHYSEVRALVPKERLLEYRVGEGWESLCEFLEKDVPDEAFPRVNDTQAFHSQMAMKVLRSWGQAAVKYVLPAVLVSAILFLYGHPVSVFA